MKVVLVDDNRDAVELLSELLGMKGYEVSVAGSVKSGLDRIREDQPDVALIDIGLPDGTGHDIARKLVEEGIVPKLLVAVTGYGEQKDIDASKEAGFHRHMVKPLEIAAILGLLEDAAGEG